MSATVAFCLRCLAPLSGDFFDCPLCGYPRIAIGPFENGPNDIARPGEW